MYLVSPAGQVNQANQPENAMKLFPAKNLQDYFPLFICSFTLQDEL